MKKFLKYLFTYIMGFITCIALIVGVVFWAFNSVTLATIEGWTGTTILDESQLEEDAVVDVKGLSLSKLIAEITKISSESDTMTIDKLITRYGLKLTDEVKALLPEKAMGMPLDKLFTEDGTNEILQNTNFEYVYSILGEESLPEPLKSALGGKSLDKVLAGDLNYVMEGVKLGYIAGVTYEKSGDNWVAVYKNPEEPTLVELLEGVAVDDLLKTFNEGGDLLKVLVDGAGERSLNCLIESITEGDTLLGEGAKISDLYKFDEATSSYSINIQALVGTMKLGHVMGYTPIEENGEIVEWLAGSEEISSINEALANLRLSEVVSGNFDVIDTLGDFYVGELLDYTPVYQAGEVVGWLNGEVEVEKIVSKFASTKVSELIEGTFDVGEELKGVKISDLLGYTSVVYPVYDGGVKMQIGGVDVTHTVWYDGGEEVSFVISALLDKTIDELTDGISNYSIGKLAGYVQIENVWYKLEKSELGGETVYATTEVDGLIKYFVGLTVDSLKSGTELEDALNEVVIGDALGYVKVGSTWYVDYESESKNTVLDGVLKSFVGLKLSDLKNSGTITNALKEVVIGEEMGYYTDGEYWYTDKNMTNKVTGILASIAGLSVGDLSNEEKIIEVINTQSVGDMLGYYYDEDNEVWCNNGTDKKPLAGINKTLAEMNVGALMGAESKIKDMTFGDLMGYGYDKVEKCWKDGDVKLNKIMQKICAGKISELESTVSGLTIADVFENDAVNGTVLSWIPSTTKISEISSTLQAKVVSATIEDYINIGVLTLDELDMAKLDLYFTGEEWTQWSIDTFFQKLIDSVPITLS